jgi:hypothetical protein
VAGQDMGSGYGHQERSLSSISLCYKEFTAVATIIENIKSQDIRFNT